METAKHYGSKLRKTLAALLASMALMAVLLPGALAVDLNVDVGFYFKQSRGGTCTLASAAMMLRRRAYLDGMDSWVDVTENGIKSTAWSGGLSHSFTYNDMHVGYATLPSGKAAKTGALVSILAEHPEGIVLYDRTRPHAVLLTDYTDGVFYCSDPSNGVASGRVPLSAASISIGGASCYWYITSDAKRHMIANPYIFCDDRFIDHTVFSDDGILHNDGIPHHCAFSNHNSGTDHGISDFSVNFGTITDNAALHNCLFRNILRWQSRTVRIDLPELLVKIEFRNQVDQLHIGFPVRTKSSHVFPIAIILVCKKPFTILMAVRNHMLSKITRRFI